MLENKWTVDDDGPLTNSATGLSALEDNSKPHSLLRPRAPRRRNVSGLLKGLRSFNRTSGIHNTSSPSEDTLRTWKKGTFCDSFLTKTFQMKAQVCSSSKKPHLLESVECFGHPLSTSMGTCTLRNIVVSPSVLMRAMYDADRPKFGENKHSFALLKGVDSECRLMTVNNLAKLVDRGDYVMNVVSNLMENKTQDVSVCDTWINETVFFFTAHRFHIYFRFLDYFNIHKLMEHMKNTTTGGLRFIRISGSDNYHFPEFDQTLFPEARVQALEDLKDAKTCFKKVILVPKSYASTIFQCKNRVSLRMKCTDCDGRGLNETDISKFSNRVIRACFSRSKLPSKEDNKLVILVSRTPYLRNQNDELNHFERIMDNEEELAVALRRAFVDATVHVIHLENNTICEQIAYGHNADVYLGVHGSGLVHLWWMRNDALLYEMEPHYQMGNPSFRMLARMSGHTYHSEFVAGGYKTVHSNVKSVVENIRRLSKL